MPPAAVVDCLQAVFVFPSGLYGLGLCLGLFAILALLVMKMGTGGRGEYDRGRNLVYSDKGTYGTAGFMTEREREKVLDAVPSVKHHSGTILGMLDGKVVCMPADSPLNRNIAVYGASGSKKTRAFVVNMVLQCARRGESLIITDPKSEIYEKTSEYLRGQGYTVKIFNLVSPENSDSWNCLSEVEGQELMAQLFCDVIIKNTGSDRGDHFWDNSEMNLLKALVLYVDQSYPMDGKNIGQVYRLLTLKTEAELNALFTPLPVEHPAKAPYNIFMQANETVRKSIIIGLGTRLQVFQNHLIRLITSRDEIDMELPGKAKCAYFCITSDQDSTFDFLSSLFISFLFIKLVRYADKHCEKGMLPVPVHVLGEELCVCGTLPDLSRRISVIRSRNISMSCIFQNLAGLQNRYPDNQWQEILGNCSVQLFLGCTDELTAKYISDRTGEASVYVTSKAKTLGTWRVSDYTPEQRLAPGLERGTYGSYKYYAQGRIYDYFHNLGVTVEDLLPGHIEAFYRRLSMKENLSQNSVLHYHSVIRKSLQQLYKKQTIQSNPADLINNRPERTVYQASYYDDEQINEYLSIVKGTKMELPVLFASFYGFRRSEALGIKDTAINLRKRQLLVQHTVTVANVDHKVEIVRKDRTKSRFSLRSMPLVDTMELAIREANARQEHYRRVLGASYYRADQHYLCRDENGALLKPDYISAKHKELLEKHHLPHIRFHDLRHSCATLLLAKGVPLEKIKEWLGHSDIKITERYAHMNVSAAKDEMAGIMCTLIGGV